MPRLADYDKSIVYATRALFEGTANEGQQQTFMQWLLLNACHLNTTSFSATDRETTFAEGERHIGLQVADMRHPAALERLEKRPRKRTEASEATT